MFPYYGRVRLDTLFNYRILVQDQSYCDIVLVESHLFGRGRFVRAHKLYQFN